MMRVPGSELNPEYEGFLMDLLQELAKDVGFQFTIEENEKYGSLDAETGNWTGMIGKLVNEVNYVSSIGSIFTKQLMSIPKFLQFLDAPKVQIRFNFKVSV